MDITIIKIKNYKLVYTRSYSKFISKYYKGFILMKTYGDGLWFSTSKWNINKILRFLKLNPTSY